MKITKFRVQESTALKTASSTKKHEGYQRALLPPLFNRLLLLFYGGEEICLTFIALGPSSGKALPSL